MSSEFDEDVVDMDSDSASASPSAATRHIIKGSRNHHAPKYEEETNIASPDNPLKLVGYSPRPMVSLIVGIDNYTHIRKLKGAVADAHSMHDYLVKRLGVPPNTIDMLIDKQATRSAIIHSIKDLSRRLATHTGPAPPANAILIYFAGHGTMAKAPKDWRGEREGAPIPMICPSDVFAPTSDFEGSLVQPIPGNTIASLLGSLSKEGFRGNEYITVILDCCHSSSGVRGTANIDSTDPTRSIRSVTYEPAAMPPHLDKDIARSTENKAPSMSSFMPPEADSHVLLAACGAGEAAWEVQGRGWFTANLLRVLESVRDLSHLTYYELVERLPSTPGQHPQFEGLWLNRYIFSGMARERMSPIRRNGNVWIMGAGDAHGILPSSKFYVSSGKDPSLSKTVDINFEVIRISAFQSELKEITPTTAENAKYPPLLYGRTAFAGRECRVYIDRDDDILRPLYEGLSAWKHRVATGLDNAVLLYTLVESWEQAEIAVTHEEDRICFDLVSSHLPPGHIPTHLPFRLWDPYIYPLKDLFDRKVNFDWQLRRRGNLDNVEKFVQLEMFEQEERWEGDICQLRSCGGDLVVNGRIKQLKGNALYGLKLTNNTDHDVYASLFYFNRRDFSIRPYYLPARAHDDNTRALHRKGGTLVLTPQLPKELAQSSADIETRPIGEDVYQEIGCLKVFLTKEWVDLSYIACIPIFDPKVGSTGVTVTYDRACTTEFIPTVKVDAAVWV